jgi:hypothetical protein
MGLGELIKAAIGGVIGGVIGGAIGAAIWVAVVYFTNYEIGWIAWGVGITTGLGVAAACKDGGMVTGVLAAIIALVALLAGKYIVVQLFVDEGFGDVASEYAQNITEVNLIAAIADDVAIEYEEAGRELEWPPGSSWETAEYERDYPADLWADAKGRWEYMLPSEQDEYRTAHIEYVEGNVEQFRDTVVKEGFKESFGVLDIVFFGLAIASAFKLGASGGITEN